MILATFYFFEDFLFVCLRERAGAGWGVVVVERKKEKLSGEPEVGLDPRTLKS